MSAPNNKGVKLCHIIKRADFDGYGFNLHSEKIKPGQFIGKVDENSPAEAAGLKEGDRIIEVNGTAIGSETHKQVVQRIKAIEKEVRLLLVDVEAIRSGRDTVDLAEEVASVKGTDNATNTNSNAMQQECQKSAAVEITAASNNNATPQFESTLTVDLQRKENKMKTSSDKMPPVASSNNSNGNSSLMNNNSSSNNSKSSNSNIILPPTAAEMRAKLLSKKKYDPKTEGFDFKKKFEIIQKL